MEKIMAVYDIDPNYAQRFADVVNQKEKIPFTVVPFTSMELLAEYAGKHPIEILLVSSAVPREQIAGVEARSVVTLEEGEVVVAAEDEHTSVYKYQSADSVIREVMTCYCEQPAEDLYVVLGQRARVLGIYSPIGRCFKTSMALIMGQQLARDGKTLYISFDEFSGLGKLLEGDNKSDLSDVLYFLRQESFHVMRLRSIVYSWKDMDYIMPVHYPEDLEQMTGEEAARLIGKLASDSGYDYVIVDVGRPARNLLPILEQCNVIYMPVKEDDFSVARLEEFDEYLRIAGREKLEERIQRVRLPFHGDLRRGGGYLENLLWSDLGDYVRKLLRGAPWK